MPLRSNEQIPTLDEVISRVKQAQKDGGWMARRFDGHAELAAGALQNAYIAIQYSAALESGRFDATRALNTVKGALDEAYNHSYMQAGSKLGSSVLIGQQLINAFERIVEAEIAPLRQKGRT